MGNAVQHHDRASVQIELSIARDGANYVIHLADDGPGIASQHHETVFLPFRSLAPAGAPSSTGMGLAMVKRAVESVGGAISIVAKPQDSRGATFKIIWPRTMPSS
jgi:signal transduction histidine kinase